jgi:hypothetical protein
VWSRISQSPQLSISYVFCFITILIGEKWYFIVLVICITLIIKHFLYTAWPFLSVILKNAYMGTCPIYTWGFFFILFYLCYHFNIYSYLYTCLGHLPSPCWLIFFLGSCYSTIYFEYMEHIYIAHSICYVWFKQIESCWIIGHRRKSIMKRNRRD